MEELTKVTTKIRKKPTPSFTEAPEESVESPKVLVLSPDELAGVELSLDSDIINNINLMKASGIPVKKAVFSKTVTGWNGNPEMSFYESGAGTISSRIAKMWYTPGGLLCEQEKGYRVLVPLANVTFTVVKDD